MESDVDGSDPLTIVYTSGIHQRTQGRGAHTRRAARASTQPQRDSWLVRTRQAVLQLAVLLDRRHRLRCAGHARRGCDVGVLQRHRCRRDSGPARGREAHDDQRFRRGHRPPGAPSQLRRSRPVVDAPRQPVSDHAARRATGRSRVAAQHAGHDRDRQRQPAQRRRPPTSPSTGADRSASPRPDSRPGSSTPAMPASPPPPARSASCGSAGRTSCSTTTGAAARTASTPTDGSTPAISCAPTPTAFTTSSAGADSMIKTAGANVSPRRGGEGHRQSHGRGRRACDRPP